MHVQALKGAVFAIMIAGALDDGVTTTKNLPDVPLALTGFDPAVISVSDPVAHDDKTFTAEVTILADTGSTTIIASLGAINGAISVTVKEPVVAPPAPAEDPPATRLIITAGEPAEVIG